MTDLDMHPIDVLHDEQERFAATIAVYTTSPREHHAIEAMHWRYAVTLGAHRGAGDVEVLWFDTALEALEWVLGVLGRTAVQIEQLTHNNGHRVVVLEPHAYTQPMTGFTVERCCNTETDSGWRICGACNQAADRRVS